MAPNDDGPAGGAGAGRGKNGKFDQPSTGGAAAGPDLRDLHGRVCPSCGKAILRVMDRGLLVLLLCPNGCCARSILGACGLTLTATAGRAA